MSSRKEIVESLFSELFDQAVETAKEGVKYFSNLYNTLEEGPVVDFGRLDYPCVMIIPESTTYQGNGQYEQLVSIFFYFKRTNSSVEDLKEITRKITSSVWVEFFESPDFVDHKIQNIEDYPGTMENNLLWIREVQFRVTLYYDYTGLSNMVREKL